MHPNYILLNRRDAKHLQKKSSKMIPQTFPKRPNVEPSSLQKNLLKNSPWKGREIAHLAPSAPLRGGWGPECTPDGPKTPSGCSQNLPGTIFGAFWDNFSAILGRSGLYLGTVCGATGQPSAIAAHINFFYHFGTPNAPTRQVSCNDLRRELELA